VLFVDSEEPRRAYTRWFGLNVAHQLRGGATVGELTETWADMFELEPEGVA
jgi:hypothetical protein